MGTRKVQAAGGKRNDWKSSWLEHFNIHRKYKEEKDRKTENSSRRLIILKMSLVKATFSCPILLWFFSVSSPGCSFSDIPEGYILDPIFKIPSMVAWITILSIQSQASLTSRRLSNPETLSKRVSSLNAQTRLLSSRPMFQRHHWLFISNIPTEPPNEHDTALCLDFVNDTIIFLLGQQVPY